ncbi:class I SAM-dependent methyltransferase [Kitasatospora sp. NPDC058965]|uniref:class I SAM-dependent methyltransferase n=1 Tax=Kitasatospora sp. NPDC058965 TaxID=3346682 RepID=UPI0036C171F6
MNTGVRRPRRNRDADWDRWPVQAYLAENYRELHPADAAVIRHHSAAYRALAAGSVDRSLEVGSGPNLYPLLLAGAASRRIDAVETSASGIAYLRDQLARGPDESWRAFYDLCRTLNPDLPPTPAEALAGVRVVHADLRDLPAGRYGLASMSFVAESVTEAFDEFADICRRFAASVRPGGLLLAAFMENMPSYRLGEGPEWPGCPVDRAAVREVFAPLTDGLRITRIDSDPTLPDYGDSGMLLLRAERRG